MTSPVLTAGSNAPTGFVSDEPADAGSLAETKFVPQLVNPTAKARDLARAAAVEEALTPASVGEFIDAIAEDEVAVTLRFASKDAGYLGWNWSVTVALVDADHPTVSEVVMLPGEGSLVAPQWLPWNERIRPGDLGVGDILLPIDNDIRVVPAYLESDDPAVEDVAHELGIGRVRVMSRFGREDAAARWHEGDFGPDSEMAKAAPLTCVECAFYLPLAGSLGAMFGVCGNEMAPADGRVVDGSYGCGAGSEIVVEAVPSGFGEAIIDETTMDVYERPVVTESISEDLTAGDPVSDEVPSLLAEEATSESGREEPGAQDEPVIEVVATEVVAIEPATEADAIEPVTEVVAGEPVSEVFDTEPDETTEVAPTVDVIEHGPTEPSDSAHS